MTDLQLSRRGVLAAGAAIGGAAVLAGALPGTAAAEPAVDGAWRRPPKLVSGDRVRLVSPAAGPDHARLDIGKKMLESWGLVVEIGEHALGRFGYLSAPDADRAADVNDAFADPGVRAVFATRGGWGTGRIMDAIDFTGMSEHPKFFVGYSDVTSMHMGIWRRARVATVHGPMLAWNTDLHGPTDGPAALELKSALMSAEPVVLHRDPAIPSSGVESPGKATGRLFGGNLSILVTEPRDGNAPRTEGGILFFEDTNEAPYSVDRMLTELLRDGWFDGIAGIALGTFTSSVGNPGDWTILDVLADRLLPVGVPILGGFNVGHEARPHTMPFGTKATIDTAAGTLTVTAAAS
ncbi:S66 peptidase family protein [Phytomonospora endophytica]|uniref:Muramoyltetrapeptide carboxypeptidase n=1 Tax=Phytomonospora endophytica TaxID=714109 RepID=A0A841FEA9_9ACTN|nr:LD-carboxypeptidase [Phytomonospora endophytica]MBB6032178.1 muramoyltetrapeptide carboxypeptidase [Phytomonospora endophytica]GIG68527.1 muramoyltetrapeptide carboxypeptidase [Phytomonospora endophytica]